MCVSRVVLSANNCSGRRPEEARRAVPRLSVRRYKLSLGTDDMGVPSFQPTGETLPTGGCILALRLRRLHIHISSCEPCGLAWIKHAATTLGISRRLDGSGDGRNWWFWVEGVARPGFPGVPDLVDVTILCGRQDSSPLAVPTLLRPECSISWPAGLQHWPTAFWVLLACVSQVLSRYFSVLHAYW